MMAYFEVDDDDLFVSHDFIRPVVTLMVVQVFFSR
jgi:hypothetical protein